MPTEPENATTVEALIAVAAAVAACVLLTFGAVWVSGVFLEWLGR